MVTVIKTIRGSWKTVEKVFCKKKSLQIHWKKSKKKNNNEKKNSIKDRHWICQRLRIINAVKSMRKLESPKLYCKKE